MNILEIIKADDEGYDLAMIAGEYGLHGDEPSLLLKAIERRYLLRNDNIQMEIKG